LRWPHSATHVYAEEAKPTLAFALGDLTLVGYRRHLDQQRLSTMLRLAGDYRREPVPSSLVIDHHQAAGS
jgi:hypothetical protein